MTFEVTSLPWATLLPLASGYAGYYVANIGMRDHHRVVDVIFSTIVFGFLGAVTFVALMNIFHDIALSALGAFAIAVVLGGIWSKWGRGWLNLILRATHVSHNDDFPSAFDALVSETRTDATQLMVKVGEDQWLVCDNAAAYAKLPNGPFVLGRNGDVLMYVTHSRNGDGEFEAAEGITDPAWGTEVTYIPAGRVARIDIRRKWRKAPTSS